MYPGADPDYPQGSAVNKNLGSPYYGYLYVADYKNTTGAPKPIHIWRPENPAEGTGAATYVDTGLEILTSGTALYDPFAVSVGRMTQCGSRNMAPVSFHLRRLFRQREPAWPQFHR